MLRRTSQRKTAMHIDLQSVPLQALLGEARQRGAFSALDQAAQEIHEAAIAAIQEQLNLAGTKEVSVASKRLGRAVLVARQVAAGLGDDGSPSGIATGLAQALAEWDSDEQATPLAFTLAGAADTSNIANATNPAGAPKVTVEFDEEDLHDTLTNNGLEDQIPELARRVAHLLWAEIGTNYGRIWEACCSGGYERIEKEFSANRDRLIQQAQRDLLAGRGIEIRAAGKHGQGFEWVNTLSEKAERRPQQFPTAGEAIEAAWAEFSDEFWPQAEMSA